MKFTIDRKKWYRGSNYYSALLIGSNDGIDRISEDVGKMCCLGFLSLACGLSRAQIRNVYRVDQLKVRELPHNLAFLVKSKNESSAIAKQIMSANDRSSGTNRAREQRLTNLFAKAGITVEFVN